MEVAGLQPYLEAGWFFSAWRSLDGTCKVSATRFIPQDKLECLVLTIKGATLDDAFHSVIAEIGKMDNG
jgi:hypothetical protein